MKDDVRSAGKEVASSVNLSQGIISPLYHGTERYADVLQADIEEFGSHAPGAREELENLCEAAAALKSVYDYLVAVKSESYAIVLESTSEVGTADSESRDARRASVRKKIEVLDDLVTECEYHAARAIRRANDAADLSQHDGRPGAIVSRALLDAESFVKESLSCVRADVDELKESVSNHLREMRN